PDALPDRMKAKDTGPALPGTLRREVPHDPGSGVDAARVLGKEMDHAAAKGQPPSPQRLRLHRQCPDLVDRGPCAKVATEEDRLSRTGQSAGTGGNIAERPAEVDLLDARFPDRPRDGHQAGAGFDTASDQRRHRQALDVL